MFPRHVKVLTFSFLFQTCWQHQTMADSISDTGSVKKKKAHCACGSSCQSQ
uniref:Post-SET domain-containing protein n=1 Tax=Octopus bimaculoides TaxID=37653 RepID=A0A0L8FPV8_OCTBM